MEAAGQGAGSGERYTVRVPSLNASQTAISAYSRRQAMDWSLVLASQDIPTTIAHSAEEGWTLLVEPKDQDRALGAIRLYQAENRHWGWKQPIPWSNAIFHWGGLGWCILLAALHYASLYEWPAFRNSGRLDSAAALGGQWWRVFTAMLLHADIGHLLANTTVGLLLFGLAMARHGAALGLFAAYLAGAAGNVAGLCLYPNPYFGLGASGMVMGALGLIAVPPRWSWASRVQAVRQIARAALASVMLFVLLGVDPTSDVIAHLGGFVGGACFGLVLTLIPPPKLHDRRLQRAAGILLASLVLLTAGLAARH